MCGVTMCGRVLAHQHSVKRLVPRVFATIAIVLLAACASTGRLSSKRAGDHVSPAARLDAIRRAQVWEPTDVASMNLRVGPKGHGSFTPDEAVRCTYSDKVMTGNSPKFTCIIPPDDEVKVKFGRENGEVYAEVAATRLFWALGFPADRMYPVSVLCAGCPPREKATRDDATGAVLFDPASIERKLKGHSIETEPDSGWAWPELDTVDEAAGGAPRAHRDALKLLAVFIQHTDSKPAQQRLLCVDENADGERGERSERGVCAHPVMMVNDLGQTFGRSNLFNRDHVGSVNLEKWAGSHVWLDQSHCIGDLAPSQSGTLDNPLISEAGRKFLSDLLMRLSDAQLRDLFEVSRFEERAEGNKRHGTVDEWVNAFKKKRGEIASTTCPS
jgi:hypothetical protein